VGIRLAAILVFLFALVPLGAGAQTPATATSGFKRTIADYVVNGNTEGETKVILDGGKLFVPPDTIQAFGAGSLPPGVTHTYLGQTYVSLDSLAPDLTYTWDPEQHKITVTIAASHFGAKVIDYHHGRPSDLASERAPSAFVNYGVHESYQDRSVSSTLALDGSLTAGPGDLAVNESLAQGKAADLSSAIYTLDVPGRMLRAQAGTLPQDPRTAVPGNLVGFTVRRRFELDPYFETAPSPGLTTAIGMPSLVQVFVNGRLVDTENVQPGILDLRDLPTNGTGAGSASIVITDANGKRTVPVPSYGAPTSLRKSLTDFSATVATDSSTHDPVLGGYVRHGFSDSLSGGVVAVRMGQYQRFGADAAMRTLFGTLTASLDTADSGIGTGASSSLQYNYSGMAISTGIQVAKTTPGWLSGPPAAVGLTTALLRTPTFSAGAYVGAQRLPGAPFLRWSHDTTDPASLILGFQVPTHVGPLTVAVTRQAGHGTAFSIQYTRSGRRVDVSTSYDSTQHQAVLESSLHRSDGKGSTDLTVDTPSLDRIDVTSTAEWANGTYTAELERQDGALSGEADFEGALAFVGSRLFSTAPIQDGFALVRIAGIPNVSVDLDGRPVGRTDKSGDLIVPQLIGGLANTVQLHDDDLPLSTRFDRTKQVVTPLGRAGMLIDFPYRHLHAWRGKIAFVRAAKREAPVNGALTIGTGKTAVEADLSGSGAFYLDDLAPGHYSGHVDADNGVCDVDIVAAAHAGDSVVQLGTLTCEAHQQQ
jgi:outer membrane usher protein